MAGKKLRKLKYKPVIAVLIIILTVVLLFVFLRPSKRLLNDKEALSLGETKYLEFLWMVDGAFNNSEEEFTVNGKTLDKKLDFSCTFDKDKNIYNATNFEKNFNNIFANNITMDMVYGDGVAIKWYFKDNNGYHFNNSYNCKEMRMSRDHHLKVVSIDLDKIVYQATFDDKNNNGYHENKFILINQDSTWKVSEAYYHDSCYAEYIIK